MALIVTHLEIIRIRQEMRTHKVGFCNRWTGITLPNMYSEVIQGTRTHSKYNYQERRKVLMPERAQDMQA